MQVGPRSVGWLGGLSCGYWWRYGTGYGNNAPGRGFRCGHKSRGKFMLLARFLVYEGVFYFNTEAPETLVS